MSQTITNNVVVTLAYKVSDTDGEVLDEGVQPLIYLHGAPDGIFPKIAEALEGKGLGEQITITLAEEDAFGPYNEDLLRSEDAALFPPEVEVGQVFQGNGHPFLVTEITEGRVIVDGNHPLAGFDLVFDCTVAALRAATPEEIAAGHPAH